MREVKERINELLDAVLDGKIHAATEVIGNVKVKVYKVYSFLIRVDIIAVDKKSLIRERRNHAGMEED